MAFVAFKSFQDNALFNLAEAASLRGKGLSPGPAGSPSWSWGSSCRPYRGRSARFLFKHQHPESLFVARIENRDVRIIQLVLSDMETGARGFVLSGRMEYLQPYMAGLETVDANKVMLSTLDRYVRTRVTGSEPGTQSFTATYRSQDRPD